MKVETGPEKALQKRQFTVFLKSILIADKLWSLQCKSKRKQKYTWNVGFGGCLSGGSTAEAPPSGS